MRTTIQKWQWHGHSTKPYRHRKDGIATVLLTLLISFSLIMGVGERFVQESSPSAIWRGMYGGTQPIPSHPTGFGFTGCDESNHVCTGYQQEPQLTSSGSNTYYVGAQAPIAICSSTCSYLTNTGVQTTIQVVSQQVTGCLSYWIGDDSKANIWGQVGYYICNGSTPLAFVQVWNLTAHNVLTTVTNPVSTGYHNFSMYDTSRNIWAYTLDGALIATYNMGADITSQTYPVQMMSEEGYVSNPWTPAPSVVPIAIETMNANPSLGPVGVWSQMFTAFEPWGCASSAHACWGIQGNLQNNTLPRDALNIGGNAPVTPPGAYLWNASSTNDSTPPTITITSPANGTILSGTFNAAVSATDPDSAVSTVSLYVDANLYGVTSTTPYMFPLDTTKLPNGIHKLVAEAVDPSGNIGTSPPVAVTVSNPTGNAMPVIAITSPKNGSMLPSKGSFTIYAAANDALGVTRMQVFFDSVALATCLSSTSCQTTMSVNKIPSGSHTITVTATDNSTTPSTSSASITVYKPHKITFQTSPTTSGSITFNGTVFINGENGNYTYGAVPISAQPPDGYTFSSWSVTGGITVANNNNNVTTATISGPGTLQVNFSSTSSASVYPSGILLVGVITASGISLLKRRRRWLVRTQTL